MTSDQSVLTIERGDHVVRLTLSRPEQLNALDDRIRRALANALDDLEDQPDVRVVVVRGAGRAFSAGADLRTTAYPLIEGDWATRRHRTGTWQRLLEQLDRIPQVTVAGLHGHVIGGAALLAAACDIRIAAADTVLRIPELAIGIPLTWAGIPLLVREVGLPAARDWVMTCRAVAVDELLRTGFVTRVADSDALDEAVDDCVQELLAVPPGPLAMTRAMTSAIGRTAPPMVAAWSDADHQLWSFAESEYRDAVREYVRRIRRGGE
jgi:enoyl-CoA hydratase/carnithine racemase